MNIFNNYISLFYVLPYKGVFVMPTRDLQVPRMSHVASYRRDMPTWQYSDVRRRETSGLRETLRCTVVEASGTQRYRIYWRVPTPPLSR